MLSASGYVTSVMLKYVPKHVSIDMFVELMQEEMAGGFDFIYMPQSQWTSKPVGLVFINFESPAHAKQGIIHLRGLSVRAHWERIEVKEAEIQGLLPNLAYFVARFGLDAVRNEDAPQVFQGGVRVEVGSFVSRHRVFRAQGDDWWFRTAVSSNKKQKTRKTKLRRFFVRGFMELCLLNLRSVHFGHARARCTSLPVAKRPSAEGLRQIVAKKVVIALMDLFQERKIADQTFLDALSAAAQQPNAPLTKPKILKISAHADIGARTDLWAQQGYRCGRRYLRATSQDIGVCGYRHAHRYLQGPSWHRRSRGYRRTPKSPSKYTSACGKRIATLGNWRARRYLLGPSNKDTARADVDARAGIYRGPAWISARAKIGARADIYGDPCQDIGTRGYRRARRYLPGPNRAACGYQRARTSARAPVWGAARMTARANIGARAEYRMDFLAKSQIVICCYRLGCILYTLAFYRHPFQDNATPMAVFNAKYVIPSDHPMARTRLRRS
ncbi:unnamed protein product [Effrenium voratum]|uniref:Mei2-like C-terminal RNA recognition motif domain-containing protein n=1 Tax=Effrenium voratum TaxID=2562239 RepID=A0AA36ND15_9DINO|nr:unnamed protein product [Effrenium voratum]